MPTARLPENKNFGVYQQAPGQMAPMGVTQPAAAAPHKAPIAPKVAVHKAPPKPFSPKPMTPTLAPYDSTYQMNMASDQLNRNNQLAGMQQQSSLDTADTSEALRRLGMQRAQQSQQFNANSARNGSLMSGRAMQGYGRMETGYQQRSNDMQDQLARRMAGRSLQQQTLQQGAGIYQNAQTMANTERAAQNAYNNRLALYLAQKKV